MTLADIAHIRQEDPEAVVIVHGEVKPELQQAADEVMSTSQMAKYVASHPRRSAWPSSPSAGWWCVSSWNTPIDSSTSPAGCANT